MEIDAIRLLNSESALEIVEWAGGAIRWAPETLPRYHSVECLCEGRGVVSGRDGLVKCPESEPTGGGPGFLAISTLEGEMRANIGDWVIRGVAGEFYPCRHDIFQKTYEQSHV